MVQLTESGMVQLTEFPLDVLSIIMLMLATSTEGAKHLARFAALCSLFRQHAKHYSLLKVVNFRHLISTDDYTKHHHARDLLCVCAHNGNRAAKLILAKAILYKDTWFKKMLEDNNQEALDFNVSYSGSELLHSHELVRKFIRYGSNRDLLKMHNHLLSYVTAYVGYKVARAYGMYDAIKEMCTNLVIRIGEPRITLRSYDTLGNNVHVRVLSSRFRSDREKVLAVFDKLFPPLGPV